MPRLSTQLLRKAYAIDPWLPALLAPCRDLGTAQNELRWLREHVDRVAQTRQDRGDTLAKNALLKDLVKQRSKGKPLQYILGTEFFGDLELRVNEGVLIPRQDTAASITHLVRLIRDARNLPSELRVLDLCTGSGCIPLLFGHELDAARPDISLRALGVDVSEKALKLASHNLKRVGKNASWVGKSDIDFMQANILLDPFGDYEGGVPFKVALNYQRRPPFWDILVSNPPYISLEGYWKTTTRSVRKFEPELALVPPEVRGKNDVERGDRFYEPILSVAQSVEAKIVLLEVADLEQALRVVQKARALDIFDGVEIWRDQPDVAADASSPTSALNDVPIIGLGNARSVVCWRYQGASWLGKLIKHDSSRVVAAREPATLEPSFDRTKFLLD